MNSYYIRNNDTVVHEVYVPPYIIGFEQRLNYMRTSLERFSYGRGPEKKPIIY